MKYLKEYPLSKTGLLAIPSLGFILVMENMFPHFEIGGYKSYIIALEFVKTTQEVRDLLSLLNDDQLTSLNIGNYIDYGFMLTYSMLLGLFWNENFKRSGRQTLRFGYLLVALVFIGDFLENVQLLSIVNVYRINSTGDLEPFLERLQIFTWLKWEGLAIIFVGIGTSLMRRGNFSKVIGAMMFIPFLISLRAFGSSPMAVTIFTSAVFLVFFLLILYCFIYKPKEA